MLTHSLFSNIDIHFARLMTRLSGQELPELSLAAALVSSYTRQGHICLDLSVVEGKQLLEKEEVKVAFTCPELDIWSKKLRKSPVVGNPGQFRPLILDQKSRLYLFRYWDYQEKLAYSIMERVNKDGEILDYALLMEGLDRLFTEDHTEGINWQKVAAFTSLSKIFCVISGGPGTGKTTTVAKILALLLEQPGSKKPRIALTAPTGKAAARLQEAIIRSKKEINCPDNIKAIIPEDVSTIHRLLGSIPYSPYFRHNAKNRLLFDVVVVDEASMVDMPLMSKLIQALSSQTRLILLGDKDQLASVEAGAVLGDICDTGNDHSFSKRFVSDLENATGYRIHTKPNREDDPGIQDCIIQLRKSYRFGGESGIGAASQAVNTGDGDLALRLFKNQKYRDIIWKELPRPDSLARSIRAVIIEWYGDYLRTSDPLKIFQMFERFRILCVLRGGPYGVVAINSLVEQILRQEKLIKAEERWYAGRPVMIIRNDYNLMLFNGDTGIALPDHELKNELRVYFPATDGTLRKFHPARLPEHETVYAMTVHKSQGSEFDKILFLLPDRDSPVLTRELIYTGITRSKVNVEIWGTDDVFRAAISRRIERASGLRDALWIR